MATSDLCGLVGFTTNNKPEVRQAHALISGQYLRILHDDGQIKFNLKQIVGHSPNHQPHESVHFGDLEYKYSLNVLFRVDSQFTDVDDCFSIDIYTNNCSLYSGFNEKFNRMSSPSTPTDAATPDATAQKKQSVSDNDLELSEEFKESQTDHYPGMYGRSESTATGSTTMELSEFRCNQHQPTTRTFLCEECGAFSHRKKPHSFNKFANHIQCVNHLMEYHTDQYENGSKIARAIQGFNDLKQVIHHQRWFNGAMLSMAGPASASVIVYGTPTTVAACGVGSHVIGAAVGVALGGCVIGVAIGTAIEWRYINNKLKAHKISKEEAARLKKVAVAANTVSGLTYVGCMAIGAAVGTPGGPIGTVIGAIIGGIAFGLGSRYLFHWFSKKKADKEQKKRTQIQREALDFFFHDETYDIHDPNKFNERKLKQTYRRLAVIFHPDMENGDYEEWHKLSEYYGVLTTIFEALEEENNDANTNPPQVYDCPFTPLACDV
eukprot:618869_1